MISIWYHFVSHLVINHLGGDKCLFFMLYFNANLFEEIATENNRYISKKTCTTRTVSQQNSQLCLVWSSVRKCLSDWWKRSKQNDPTEWKTTLNRCARSSEWQTAPNQAHDGNIKTDCALCSNREVKGARREKSFCCDTCLGMQGPHPKKIKSKKSKATPVTGREGP
jgi:hypothetical protein